MVYNLDSEYWNEIGSNNVGHQLYATNICVRVPIDNIYDKEKLEEIQMTLDGFLIQMKQQIEGALKGVEVRINDA